MMDRDKLKELLLKNRRIIESSNCWFWIGRVNANNYGVISLPKEDNSRSRDYLVHRLSFEIFKYKPTNLVCHIKECLFQECFNPDHLYEGTHTDNMIDSLNTGSHGNQYGKTSKLFCKNGHPLFGENVRITTEGRRRCLTCQKEYNMKNQHKYRK